MNEVAKAISALVAVQILRAGEKGGRRDRETERVKLLCLKFKYQVILHYDVNTTGRLFKV